MEYIWETIHTKATTIARNGIIKVHFCLRKFDTTTERCMSIYQQIHHQRNNHACVKLTCNFVSRDCRTLMNESWFCIRFSVTSSSTGALMSFSEDPFCPCCSYQNTIKNVSHDHIFVNTHMHCSSQNHNV